MPKMNALIKGIACALLALPACVHAKAVIINPSFEQDDFSATAGKGIINDHNPGGITGWLHSNKTTGISLVSKDGDVFANNGGIPDGLKVAFIQGDGKLSQTIGGLTPGNTYKITYYENATAPKTGAAAIKLTVSVDDQVIVDPHAVESVGGTNPYRKVESKPFTAGDKANLAHLKFETSDAQGESAVLLDNVHIELVSGTEEPNSGIKYYGFINTATQYMGDGNDIDKIGKVCNIAWIENYGPDYDLGKIPAGASTGGQVSAANAVKMVNEAAAMGLTSHVSLHYIFFDSKYHLRSDWQARWNKYAEELAPAASHITSLSTIDEPYLAFGESTKEQLTADLATANKAIKEKFPNLPILVIYAFKTMVDLENVVVPEGYDWVGFDGYPFACMVTQDNMEGYSVHWFYNAVRSKLRPGQRTIMVPELWFVGSRPESPKAFSLEIANNYNRLLKLAQDDPLCIGIFNFAWPTWIHPTEKNSGSTVIGTDSIPYMADIAEMYLKNLKDPSLEIVLTPLTASDNQSTKGTVGTKAFDKKPETYWTASNSNKDTSWLLADYKQPWQVSKLRLLTYRGEESASKKIGYSIYAGVTPDDLKLVKKIETTGDKQKLEVEFPPEIGSNVRYIKIEADGPQKEAFGWREIELVEAGPKQ